MREVEAYRLFGHIPGVIHAEDHAVAAERGGEPGSKTVYVLLPYYRRGNLQDMINANAVNHATFPEKRLMMLILGVCRALKEMHQYKGRPAGADVERMEMGHGDEEDPGRPRRTGRQQNAKGKGKGREAGQRVASNRAAVPDEDEEGEQQRGLLEGDGAAGGEGRSYAHRDIKPGESFNVPPFGEVEVQGDEQDAKKGSKKVSRC